MKHALLVIDVQNDFCPGGALAVAEGDRIVAPINALMAKFDAVILTQDWHPAGHSSFASQHPGKAPMEMIDMPYGPQVLWPDHCIQGSPGANFHTELEMDRADLIIRKGFRAAIDSYSAFFENDRRTPTGLEGYLRSRGIPEDQARRLVVRGFFGEVLNKITLPELKERLEVAVEAELALTGV